MSSRKDRYKKGIPNDLNDNDPDFDLDDYIHENSIDDGEDIGPDVTYRVKKKNTKKRDRLVIAAVLAIIFLWYFDWNPLNAVTQTAQGIGGWFGSDDNIAVVESPGSDVSASSGSYLDYIAAVRAVDFRETPSEAQIQAMYNNGVPVSYMQKLEELNYLGEVNYSGLIGLWANGVTENYLQTLHDLDYLDEIGYPGIVGMYSSGVSEDYLVGLNRIDYLDEINYTGIIGLYSSGVPISYLQTLNRIDYLDEVSYTGIIGMYSTGVTEEFLRELSRRDMLDDLSYTQIIQIYQNN